METVLKTTGLRKWYGNHPALTNLELELPAVLTAALAVAGSLLSIWLTKNKLNLP